MTSARTITILETNAVLSPLALRLAALTATYLQKYDDKPSYPRGNSFRQERDVEIVIQFRAFLISNFPPFTLLNLSEIIRRMTLLECPAISRLQSMRN